MELVVGACKHRQRYGKRAGPHTTRGMRQAGLSRWRCSRALPFRRPQVSRQNHVAEDCRGDALAEIECRWIEGRLLRCDVDRVGYRGAVFFAILGNVIPSIHANESLRVFDHSTNRPALAAAEMYSRFLGSSMNLGSARMTPVTTPPSLPSFRSCRPPPAGACPVISSPYLVRDAGLAASLATVVVLSISGSNA